MPVRIAEQDRCLTPRVLHISNYYPPHIGGIEQVCHTAVVSTPLCKHRVICFNDRRKTEISTYEGIRVVRVGTFARIASQPLPTGYIARLWTEIRAFRPDIVHLHLPNPLISVYLLFILPRRCKLIVHYHAEILTSDLLYACYRPLEKLLFRRADLILVTSPKMRDEAAPLHAFRDKCRILCNVINPRKFDLTSKEMPLVHQIRKNYEGRKIIFSCGRHVSYKGLRYLIEAEQHIQTPCIILIGGSGPLTPQLRAMARSERIRFLGRIPEARLKYYLHAADLFAFPSITRAEAFGVTLLENMYCRTPPVTFTIAASGVNYVSQNGITGLEVPNADAKAFAQAIDRLLSDDTLRLRMAEAGHKRVSEMFTIEQFKQQLERLYQSVINNCPA